jgi:hypothetical protein
MRDSFIIYRSFYEAIVDLPTEAQAQVWNAICEYSLNFNEPQLTGIAKTVFTLIRPQLEANIKRYTNGKKQDGSKLKASEKQNGSKTEAKEKQSRSKTEANKNVNVNVNVNENENVKGKRSAPAPTLEEVQNFFKENGYSVEIATKAYHYYAEAGWKDSRGEPVRAWKQKMRGVWFRDEHKPQAPKEVVLPTHYNPAIGDVPAVWQPADQYRPA